MAGRGGCRNGEDQDVAADARAVVEPRGRAVRIQIGDSLPGPQRDALVGVPLGRVGEQVTAVR